MNIILLLMLIFMVWIICGVLATLIVAKNEKCLTYEECEGFGILILTGLVALVVTIIVYYIEPRFEKLVNKILHKINGGNSCEE